MIIEHLSLAIPDCMSCLHSIKHAWRGGSPPAPHACCESVPSFPAIPVQDYFPPRYTHAHPPPASHPLQCPHTGRQQISPERGIQKHDIKRFCRRRQPGFNRRLHHLDLRCTQQLQLFTQAGRRPADHCRPAPPGRTTRRGLYTQCTTAGIQVKTACIPDHRTQPVKQCFANPVRGWTHPGYWRKGQFTSAPATGNDA